MIWLFLQQLLNAFQQPTKRCGPESIDKCVWTRSFLCPPSSCVLPRRRDSQVYTAVYFTEVIQYEPGRSQSCPEEIRDFTIPLARVAQLVCHMFTVVRKRVKIHKHNTNYFGPKSYLMITFCICKFITHKFWNILHQLIFIKVYV
jgi:hypothetical protein